MTGPVRQLGGSCSHFPEMFPHLDLEKSTVGRENEEVKLIEPRDVQ
jgi:hypothetical protein